MHSHFPQFHPAYCRRSSPDDTGCVVGGGGGVRGVRLVHVEYIGPEGPARGAVRRVVGPGAPAPPTEQIIGAPADRSTVKACLERYRRVSAAIFKVLGRHTDALEKGSLDEAFLDVRPGAAGL